MKRVWLAAFALIFCKPLWAADFSSYLKAKPKLVIVIVVDQLRADQPLRSKDRFLPPGSSARPGGFRYLMEKGAYFPFAQYQVLQNMTCSGHAMILTGATPALNGIAMNSFYDKKTARKTYCAFDPEHGVSPRRLNSSTVGDELKGAFPESKVVSVSVKDRSSIMLGGHRADGVFWFGENRWTTSTYYSPKAAVPAWLTKIGADNAKITEKELEKQMHGALGVRQTVDAALAAFREYKLGRGKTPDLLAISFSSHDLIGHEYGPDSPEVDAISVVEDRELARLLREVASKLGGLDRVTLVLTSDHGVPPYVKDSQSWMFPSVQVDHPQMEGKIEKALTEKFGKPKEKNWIAYSSALHFYFNDAVLKEKNVDPKEAELLAKAVLKKEPGVFDVITRSDVREGLFDSSPLSEEIAHSYHPESSGDLVLIPLPYSHIMIGREVTHISGWSYDRSVPVVIAGPGLKPGVYPGGRVIDIAPTLSFLLGILPPAMSEGRVLSEVLK